MTLSELNELCEGECEDTLIEIAEELIDNGEWDVN
ncbi:hypothetical protein [Vibrio phage vB_VpaP_SJSY21]|nr:hypothetical protein [Vibrio phage vB_VpaP_SJSY21]